MRNRSCAARSFLAAWLIAFGAACSSGKSPVGYTKIDDMEGGGFVIEWPPPPGMVPGIWTAGIDCTQAHSISPLPYFVDPNGWSFEALPTPEETFPGVVSTHAARLRTTVPLVGIWGASMGFDLAELPSADGGENWPPTDLDAGVPAGSTCRQGQSTDVAADTVDLGAYSGITFWAKADPAGATSLVVIFVDKGEDPRGGICNATNPNDTSQCYNGFSVTIPLAAALTRYTVDFSSLQQDPAWGYHPSPNVFDLHHAYNLSFQINAWPCQANQMCAGGSSPPVTFDLWVDDIYFVKK
jgi:hypothetical protein